MWVFIPCNMTNQRLLSAQWHITCLSLSFLYNGRSSSKLACDCFPSGHDQKDGDTGIVATIYANRTTALHHTAWLAANLQQQNVQPVMLQERNTVLALVFWMLADMQCSINAGSYKAVYIVHTVWQVAAVPQPTCCSRRPDLSLGPDFLS